MYIFDYMCVYIYIYIYRERERERDIDVLSKSCDPNPVCILVLMISHRICMGLPLTKCLMTSRFDALSVVFLHNMFGVIFCSAN